MLVMRRMGWSWRDLLETPALLVSAVMADYDAEAEASRILERWNKR